MFVLVGNSNFLNCTDRIYQKLGTKDFNITLLKILRLYIHNLNFVHAYGHEYDFHGPNSESSKIKVKESQNPFLYIGKMQIETDMSGLIYSSIISKCKLRFYGKSKILTIYSRAQNST